VEGGRAVPVADEFEDVPTSMVVSSIGSVPEPMPGIEQDGLLYPWVDPDLGRLDGWETVFSTGNVVTGKGNIVASRRHSKAVTSHVVHDYLGFGNGSGRAEPSLVTRVTARPGLTRAHLATLLARVAERQRRVGFDGSYADWIERVTPSDLA
jgi:ferredoxin--NADP+ reductase